MGSWNGTCAISHLPIQCGEEIKLVLLSPNTRELEKLSTASGYVYSNDIFAPSMLPITGKYNDYGGIEEFIDDIPFAINPLILSYGIEKMMVENKEYNNNDLIGQVDGSKKILELVLNGIERGEYEIFTEGDISTKELAQKVIKNATKSNFSKPKILKEWEDLANADVSAKWRKGNISFVMIRKDVWDHIVKMSGHKKDYYDRYSGGYLTGREFYRNEFNKLVNSTRGKLALVNDESDGYYKKLHELNRDFESTLNTLFIKFGYAGGREMDGIEVLKYALEQAIETGTEDEIFEPLLELRLIESFMSGTRRGWIPQAGAGSQQNGWKEHQILSSFITGICNEKIEEELKDEEEYS